MPGVCMHIPEVRCPNCAPYREWPHGPTDPPPAPPVPERIIERFIGHPAQAQVLVTICHHRRPMAARLYRPDDPDAHEWWAAELRSLPKGWKVELWPREANITWCPTCESVVA